MLNNLTKDQIYPLFYLFIIFIFILYMKEVNTFNISAKKWLRGSL